MGKNGKQDINTLFKDQMDMLKDIDPLQRAEQEKMANFIMEHFGTEISSLTRMSLMMFAALTGRQPTKAEEQLILALNGSAFQFGYTKGKEEKQ